MSSLLDQDYELTPEQIAGYRADGFISLPDVFTGEMLEQLRDVVAAAVETERDRDWMGQGTVQIPRTKTAYEQIFIQKVNLWTRHADVRPFVLSRRLGNLAARLSGRPVRVWHDQALFKEPRTGAKTPWHQDAVYWPHVEKRDQLSVWIALRDATIANGCMSFLPGTHALGALPPVNLADPRDLLAQASTPATTPVTCPLKAGSATFHNGLTFHCAGPNTSDAMREALAIIYMPDETIFDGGRHPVTDPLKETGLAAGDGLAGEAFPAVSDV